MKKIILILGLLFITTGCTVINLNSMSEEECAKYIIEHNNNIYNVNNIGYRYYLPRGFKVNDSLEYNNVLYSNGYKYYMYVDIVSYYNKIDNEYTNNGDSYISQSLNYDGKNGYLEVNKKENGMYHIEMLYNYAKIEVMVRKRDIKSAIINSSYILSSVRYNDSVIKNKVSNGSVSYKEKTYKVDKPDNEKEDKNILDYVEEYDKYNDTNNEIPDTDIVGN